MNDQRQHTPTQQTLLPGTGGEAGAPDAQLDAERAHLGRIFAAADAILDTLRTSNNERFLEQARQSGGQ